MSNVVIRAAAGADLETIADFNVRLAEETEGTSLDRETVRQGVRTLLSDETRGSYFVACAGGIIGQMMHTREWSDWRNGDIWWVQSVYVHPDFRRQGVFRSLYGHLKTLAKSNPGVVGLRLYVEQENHAAQATYAGAGMRRTRYLLMQHLFGEHA
jgi:ribosomal protein S18 acetylase RimI-like enzyme